MNEENFRAELAYVTGQLAGLISKVKHDQALQKLIFDEEYHEGDLERLKQEINKLASSFYRGL